MRSRSNLEARSRSRCGKNTGQVIMATGSRHYLGYNCPHRDQNGVAGEEEMDHFSRGEDLGGTAGSFGSNGSGRSFSVKPVLENKESRKLYIENMRLWDCLTLMRSDSTMSMQAAIDLVFGMRDDKYLLSFPDTRQLLYLRFPDGVVRFPSDEEAERERLRLKDENARLHAAVWVLRDNPSLQADATVAAIFRLNDEQFVAKFHISLDDVVPQLKASITATSENYRNNNKATKKRPGRDSKTSIQLSGKPIRISSAFSRRTRSASPKPSQCSLTPFTPVASRRKQGKRQDFTSNWKRSSFEDLCRGGMDHNVLPKALGPMIGEGGHLTKQSKDWSRLSLSREREREATSGDHDSSSEDSPCRSASQITEPHRTHHFEMPKRSNTVCGTNSRHRERPSGRSYSHTATPINCICFEEPSLNSNTRPQEKYLQDHAGERKSRREEYCRRCPLSKPETINSNERGRFVEPSKRHKRKIHLSPVLDPRASFNRLVLCDSSAVSCVPHSASTSDVPDQWSRSDASNNNTGHPQGGRGRSSNHGLVIYNRKNLMHLARLNTNNNARIGKVSDRKTRDAELNNPGQKVIQSFENQKTNTDHTSGKTQEVADPNKTRVNNKTDRALSINYSFSNSAAKDLIEYKLSGEGLEPSQPPKESQGACQSSAAIKSKSSLAAVPSPLPSAHRSQQTAMPNQGKMNFQKSSALLTSIESVEPIFQQSSACFSKKTTRRSSFYPSVADSYVQPKTPPSLQGMKDERKTKVQNISQKNKETLITFSSQPTPMKTRRNEPYSISNFRSVADFLEHQRIMTNGSRRKKELEKQKQKQKFRPHNNSLARSESSNLSSPTWNTKMPDADGDVEYLEPNHRKSVKKYNKLSSHYTEKWPSLSNSMSLVFSQDSTKLGSIGSEPTPTTTYPIGRLKNRDRPKNQEEQLQDALKLLKRFGRKRFSPALKAMLKQAHPSKPYTPPPGSGTWIKGTAPP